MTDQSTDSVQVERHGATALIRLCRPEIRNALDPEMRAALGSAIEDVRSDPSVKAVVLTGSGGCFCAGGDVRGMSETLAKKRDIFEGRSRILDMHRWFEDLADLEKPLIAAIDGVAFGAGLSLSLIADHGIATSRASFCAVFARVGYVPDLGAMYFLPRQIGLRAAKDLVFSARVLDVVEAKEIGLIQTIVDGELEQAALDYAARFHDAPTDMIGIAKVVMNRAFESDRASLLNQEAMAQAMCRESDFHHEAVRRFNSKEPLQFVWKEN